VPALSDLFDISNDHRTELNADFHQRVEMSAQISIAESASSSLRSSLTEPDSETTEDPQIQVMESARTTRAGIERTRITSVVTLQAGSVDQLPIENIGIEALVLQGKLNIKGEHNEVVSSGHYIRIPALSNVDLHSKNGCQLFVKFGEMVISDEGLRQAEASC